MSRKATITTTFSIKMNTGNYETLDVSESIQTEVSFASLEELEKKDSALTELAIARLKEAATVAMAATGRRRMALNQPIGLWDQVGPKQGEVI